MVTIGRRGVPPVGFRPSSAEVLSRVQPGPAIRYSVPIPAAYGTGRWDATKCLGVPLGKWVGVTLRVGIRLEQP